MYKANDACIHNFNWPMDDYGNQIMEGFSYYGWIYSTCTYGGFGMINHSNDYSADI